MNTKTANCVWWAAQKHHDGDVAPKIPKDVGQIVAAVQLTEGRNLATVSLPLFCLSQVDRETVTSFHYLCHPI